MHILNPQQDVEEPPKTVSRLTRVKHARISVENAGVLTPGNPIQATPSDVPFILKLEPLYFGLLPASILPFVFVLGAVLLVASLGVPRIHRYLQRIALQARKEIVIASRKKAQ
jgi:hypothetical protein